MVAERDFVALFHSIHRVLEAEKLLKEQRADFLLIPAPRELSSSCGLALRFAPEQRQHIEAILQGADLPPVELFVREAQGYRPLLSASGKSS